MASFALPARAAGNDYPNHQVRLVTWSGAGSTIDLFVRLMAEGLSQRWGQAENPIVVERRRLEEAPAAIVASEYVAGQAPDGYTILITTTTAQIHNALLKLKIPYDPVRSFDPVSMLVQGQYAFVVAKSAPT